MHKPLCISPSPRLPFSLSSFLSPSHFSSGNISQKVTVSSSLHSSPYSPNSHPTLDTAVCKVTSYLQADKSNGPCCSLPTLKLVIFFSILYINMMVPCHDDFSATSLDSSLSTKHSTEQFLTPPHYQWAFFSSQPLLSF